MEIRFTAETLDGDEVEFEFNEISSGYPEDDVFYITGSLNSIPCRFSTVHVVPQFPEAVSIIKRLVAIVESFAPQCEHESGICFCDRVENVALADAHDFLAEIEAQ